MGYRLEFHNQLTFNQYVDFTFTNRPAFVIQRDWHLQLMIQVL